MSEPIQEQARWIHTPVLVAGLVMVGLGFLAIGGALLAVVSAFGEHETESRVVLDECMLAESQLKGRVDVYELLFVQANADVVSKALDEYERRQPGAAATTAGMRLWLRSGQPAKLPQAVGGP